MSNIKHRTIIYGGSFDPVTRAHIDIVEKLCRRFDRVVVVPCKISPFKKTAPASNILRLEMLEIALSHTTAEISTIELASTGPSYSYITADAFKEDTELYWAIGSEMLRGLIDWKNFEQLSDAVTFYVVPRPDFPLDIEPFKVYNNVRLIIADFSGNEGSSSEVKISVAMKQHELYLTTAIAAFVKKRGLYLDYDYVNELFVKYKLTQNRINHSFSTALCGVRLAKRAGVDIGDAITALLLHDIGKSTDVGSVAKMQLILPDEVSDMPDSIKHAPIGEAILSQLEGITNKDILGAVRWHTTGKAKMSKLEIIVFLADYIEPLRDFDGVDGVRTATTESIDDGLRAALKNTVQHFHGKDLYHSTIEAYDYYTRSK